MSVIDWTKPLENGENGRLMVLSEFGMSRDDPNPDKDGDYWVEYADTPFPQGLSLPHVCIPLLRNTD